MSTLLSSTLGRFRLVAVLEGISYLLLLLIAMPLKYAAGVPEPVLIIGWIHGLLFILFMLCLLEVWIKHRWSFLRVLMAFLYSLVPFGGFILDRKLRKETRAEKSV